MASKLHSPIGMLIGAYSTAQEGEETFNSTLIVQAVSFLALSYMSIVVYWSLFHMNLGWEYTLAGPQQSPPSSLIFNGEYFSRLQFSLGYNFLLILNAPRLDQTSFHKLMSNMRVAPVFGTSFNIYIPLLLVIVALVTLFHGYSYLLKFIGVESEELSTSMNCSFFYSICGKSKSATEDDGGVGGGRDMLSADDSEKLNIGKKLILSELRLAAAKPSSSSSSSTSSSSFSSSSSSSRHVINPIAAGITFNTSSMGATIFAKNGLSGSVKSKSNKGLYENFDDDDIETIELGVHAGNKNYSFLGGSASKKDNNFGLGDEEQQSYSGRYS